MPAPDRPACGADVSVIVPVYAQWHMVPDLLAALVAQTCPPAEIILVNNQAPAPPPPLTLPRGARIIDCTTPGSYAARNAGAAGARGRWLLFTDADCRPHRRWVAAMIAALAAAPRSLAAGPVTMILPPTPNDAQIFDAVRGIPQARFIGHGYAATANLALAADVFHNLGGFDPARLSGGDAAFCLRARRHGHTLHLVPDAVVGHPARDSFAALATKARRIKGGQVAAGPPLRRILWTIRSLTPPIREMVHYARSGHPARHRRIAMRVRLRLWGVELAELVRLLAGRAAPERE